MSSTFVQRWKWGAFMALVFLAAGVFALVRNCGTKEGEDARRWIVGPKASPEQVVPLPPTVGTGEARTESGSGD